MLDLDKDLSKIELLGICLGGLLPNLHGVLEIVDRLVHLGTGRWVWKRQSWYGAIDGPCLPMTYLGAQLRDLLAEALGVDTATTFGLGLVIVRMVVCGGWDVAGDMFGVDDVGLYKVRWFRWVP